MNKAELFQDFQLVKVNYYGGHDDSDSQSFYDGKSYTYKAPREWELKVGDLVVVKPNRYVVVKVVEIDAAPCPTLGSGAHAWIVCKVDVDDHRARVAREAEIAAVIFTVEAKKERERLKGEIEQYLTNEQRAILALPPMATSMAPKSETLSEPSPMAGPPADF